VYWRTVYYENVNAIPYRQSINLPLLLTKYSSSHKTQQTLLLETSPLLRLKVRKPSGRDEQGQDWITTEANFGRIRSGSDGNFFENWRTGLDRTEKIFVVVMWLFWKYQKC